MKKIWLGLGLGAGLALVSGCGADDVTRADGGQGVAQDPSVPGADAGPSGQEPAPSDDAGDDPSNPGDPNGPGAVDAGFDLDATGSADAASTTADSSADDAALSPDLDAQLSADAAPADAGNGGDVTLAQFCSGQGGVIKVPVGESQEELCTGTIARQRFKNALCTCENVDFKGYLNTGSFSASEGGFVTKAGGSVGVNGSLGLISAGDVDVGGSLRVYEGTSFGGYVHVYGDLELNRDSSVAGYIDVARDARFRGDMVVLGHTNIGRNVYTRPGKWEVPLWSFIGGQRITREFTLDKPCACGARDLLDVDAIVRAGRLQNDNANPAVNLSPSALKNLSFARTVTLPCGRFYLDEISGVGDVKIIATGRTALYVGGDVSTIGRFEIELRPGAELDLFIAGDLTQVGYGTFGDVARPSGVRVYVGGDGDIFFRGYQPFGANLYAPRSRMHSDGFIDARGSLFLRTLDMNGYLKVDYDRDVLEQGNDDACLPPKPPAPSDAGVPDAALPDASVPDAALPDASVPVQPPQCTNSCDEKCGKQACKSGMCTGCSSDADCCAPLVCYPDGRCGALLL